VLGLPPAFVHVSQYMRGFEQWFVDTVRNRRLLGALFDAIMEVQMALAGDMLAASGGDFDVVMTADDIAGQYGPLISLPAYRELIKPRQARYFDFIRSQTSAPFLYHSCGSMYDLLEDLIDIGVQAITPVQVSAAKMEPARLKQEFGDRLAFWGGVDTQWLLPFGTPQDVRRGVRELVETLGAGGGFVLAAVHNIQPEVPVQNICAMFEAAGIDCDRQ
jgi:uroporphyrinogen decarboxylase